MLTSDPWGARLANLECGGLLAVDLQRVFKDEPVPVQVAPPVDCLLPGAHHLGDGGFGICASSYFYLLGLQSAAELESTLRRPFAQADGEGKLGGAGNNVLVFLARKRWLHQ